ncbi:DUF2357 domain-containing protein [Paenibacillus amylolyticus]|uniref:DUF2357 domain-containing protein n=1 Tax=Paenibacillus amylolyticus TaxID=1451 RepID=UPI0032429331
MDLSYNKNSINENIFLGQVNLSIKTSSYTKSVTKYYDTEDCLESGYSFELTENKKTSIVFNSTDSEARLYLYGIESLLDDRIEYDEYGEAYLKPSEKEFFLYTLDYYPLIPGVYVGKLIIKSMLYYLPFCIKPKQVNNQQLELIKQDLENSIKGLAIDFIKRVISIDESTSQAVPPILLKQLMILKKHHRIVLAALADLGMKVNYRIQKEYKWTKEERAKKIDSITVRTMQTKPFHVGQLLVPGNALNFNLVENRWLKFMVLSMLKLIDRFMASLDIYTEQIAVEIIELNRYSYQESNKREIIEKQRVVVELREHQSLLLRMKSGFHMILRAPWYSEVSNQIMSNPPHTLLADARYRAVYQLYRELKIDEISISTSSELIYQWKRTDKLYEMWGYIQVLKLLNSLDFEPVSGWIYNSPLTNNTLLIPHLSSGERVTLTKNDIKINCVYDSNLPIVSEETDPTIAPLYMGKHNRPDCRLDFFIEDTYYGSLIVEFKYRPLTNFWSQSLYSTMGRYKVMEQLIAYKRDSNSTYLYGESQDKLRRIFSPRPVLEVWAIYPDERDYNSEKLYLENDSLRIMTMNPGTDMKEIKEQMNSIILLIKERMDFSNNSYSIVK